MRSEWRAFAALWISAAAGGFLAGRGLWPAAIVFLLFAAMMALGGVEARRYGS